MANSVDPDQTPQNAAPDQGLGPTMFALSSDSSINMAITIKTNNQTPLILEMNLS